MSATPKVPYTVDELILALDFYLTHGSPPRQETREQFVALMRLMHPHSAKSVEAQLRNFASLDSGPGLSNASTWAEWVWAELGDNPERCREMADKIRKRAGSA